MTFDAWFAAMTWGIFFVVWIPYNYVKYKRNTRIAKIKRRAHLFSCKYRMLKELKDAG